MVPAPNAATAMTSSSPTSIVTDDGGPHELVEPLQLGATAMHGAKFANWVCPPSAKSKYVFDEDWILYCRCIFATGAATHS